MKITYCTISVYCAPPKERHKDFKDNRAYTSFTWLRKRQAHLTESQQLLGWQKSRRGKKSNSPVKQSLRRQTADKRGLRQARSVPLNKRKERCLQKGCSWNLGKRAISVFPSWKQVPQSRTQETWQCRQFSKELIKKSRLNLLVP